MMFDKLTESIQEDFLKYIYRVEVVRQDRPPAPAATGVQRVQENRDEVAAGAGGAGQSPREGGQAGNPQQAFSDKVPRNAPCPCGSGKKYKKCHGAAA